MNQAKSTLKLLHANCQSYTTAKADLDLLIHEQEPDIINLQETLRDKKNPVHYAGYKAYHIHRTPGQTRGTALLIKSDLTSERVIDQPTNYPSECITVNLHTNRTTPLRLLSLYSPDGSLSRDYLHTELTNYPNSILVGDLNARHPTFGDITQNPNGTVLNELHNDNLAYSINPGQPTRYSQKTTNPEQPSVIDYIIGTHHTIPRITDFKVLDPIASDHRPIVATISVTPFNPSSNFKPKPRFDQANWKAYREEIDTKIRDLPQVKENRTSIDNAIKTLTGIIQAADKQHIPKTTHQARSPIPPCIVKLIKEKRRVMRSFSHAPTQVKKARINQLNKQIREDIATYREDSARNLWNNVSQKNPDKFWPTVKRFMKKGQSPAATPLSVNGKVYNTPDEQTQCFYDHFEKIHSVPTSRPNNETTNNNVRDFMNTLLETRNKPHKITEFNTKITPEDIINSIKRTRNTAPGADGLYYTHIKNLPIAALRHLSGIYEKSIEIQYFPDAWKQGTTILLPKPNRDHSHPKNHRPITLLPVMGKTLERLINNRFRTHLEENNKLNEHQSGYRKGRSTADAITRYIQKTSHSFYQGRVVLSAFYDVEKAFDKVWHEGLLYKLRTHTNLSLGLIRLMKSFLTNRTTRYRVGQSLSNPLTLLAGTPQGSVLSPTLFLLWVNDLPAPPLPTNNNGQEQYADDLTSWSAHQHHFIAQESIQSQNDDIATWSDTWRTTYNAEKTQFTAMSRKKLHYPVHITVKGQRITPTKTANTLGITVDSKLKMTAHFKKIYDRVNKRINLLKVIAGTYDHPRAPPNTTIKVYKTMIRPLMEYAPVALTMFSDYQMDRLNSLRIKAHKIAYGIPLNTNDKFVQDLLTDISPKERIYKLAKDYLSKDNRAPSIQRLVTNVRDKMPLTMRNPLYHTPIGKIMRYTDL
jgi:exonuclease III